MRTRLLIALTTAAIVTAVARRVANTGEWVAYYARHLFGGINRPGRYRGRHRVVWGTISDLEAREAHLRAARAEIAGLLAVVHAEHLEQNPPPPAPPTRPRHELHTRQLVSAR